MMLNFANILAEAGQAVAVAAPEAVAADGLGLAVMNRLGRAAAFHIIEV